MSELLVHLMIIHADERGVQQQPLAAASSRFDTQQPEQGALAGAAAAAEAQMVRVIYLYNEGAASSASSSSSSSMNPYFPLIFTFLKEESVRLESLLEQMADC